MSLMARKENLISNPINPLSTYGFSKRAGEFYVQTVLASERYFLIRTSGLFGIAGCKGKGRNNFVEAMLSLAEKKKGEIKVINDQILSPTYTVDLARKVKELISADQEKPGEKPGLPVRGTQIGNYGLYHISNNGQCSWFEFARKIFELSKVKVNLKPITTEEFGARAERPKYSVLDNHRLQKQGENDLRSWAEALEAYFEERGKEE